MTNGSCKIIMKVNKSWIERYNKVCISIKLSGHFLSNEILKWHRGLSLS
jgi:hypothetical protein